MKSIIITLVVFSFLVSCGKEKRSIKTGIKMQEFIIELSNYSKGLKSDFILIPQNGEELLFKNIDGEESLDEDLINAIDGIGVEEIFYNGAFAPDDYRLNMLLKAKARIPVLVADYLTTDSDYSQALQYNTDAGFLGFPRLSANYDYKLIPTVAPYENSLDITTLSQAKNYLYLISDSNFPDKNSFLTAIQQSNFDVVIIDAFYGGQLFTAAEINSLKTKLNGGKRLIISYMNIGAAEKYRYYWKEDWKLHHPRWLAKQYDGYAEEIWVKFWKKDWKNIIYGNDDSYTKKIIDAGFDGTYLDNVEVFYFLYFDE
jgi:cysteinyl-tRNA synthetase